MKRLRVKRSLSCAVFATLLLFMPSQGFSMDDSGALTFSEFMQINGFSRRGASMPGSMGNCLEITKVKPSQRFWVMKERIGGSSLEKENLLLWLKSISPVCIFDVITHVGSPEDEYPCPDDGRKFCFVDKVGLLTLYAFNLLTAASLKEQGYHDGHISAVLDKFGKLGNHLEQQYPGPHFIEGSTLKLEDFGDIKFSDKYILKSLNESINIALSIISCIPYPMDRCQEVARSLPPVAPTFLFSQGSHGQGFYGQESSPSGVDARQGKRQNSCRVVGKDGNATESAEPGGAPFAVRTTIPGLPDFLPPSGLREQEDSPSVVRVFLKGGDKIKMHVGCKYDTSFEGLKTNWEKKIFWDNKDGPPQRFWCFRLEMTYLGQGNPSGLGNLSITAGPVFWENPWFGSDICDICADHSSIEALQCAERDLISETERRLQPYAEVLFKELRRSGLWKE